MVDKVYEQFGRIDACFNGVGIEGERALIENYDEKVFDQVMNTNLKGTWLCLKYELKKMAAQKSK